MHNLYDEAFYDSFTEISLQSARIIAPIAYKIIQPKSVVDFGCGRGTWLKAFKEIGVNTVRGFDGSHVDKTNLLISSGEFSEIDLNNIIRVEERFDLAICLEVAEHLPSQRAVSFVENLTIASNAILFSAAIPGQGGEMHVNEQWPWYWSEIFESFGYYRLDPFRRLIVHDPRVAVWYRQNILLYVTQELFSNSMILAEERFISENAPMEYIHPYILKKVIEEKNSLKNIIKAVPHVAFNSVKKRLLKKKKLRKLKI